MSDLYDLERDGGWTPLPAPVAPEPPLRWDPTGFDRRCPQYSGAEVSTRRQAQSDVNRVTGHGMDCRCSRCPGWYEDRARLAAEAVDRATPPDRRPNPLYDQVIPVSILLVVFTACMAVLLPVITPLIALSAMSLGLVAICVTIIAIVGLGLVGMFRRAAREAGGISSAPVVKGRVLRRR